MMDPWQPLSQDQLVGQVASAGGLSLAAAEQALRQVLRSISRACGSGACSELLQVLPPSLAAELTGGTNEDPLVDRQIFVGRMIQSYDTEYGYDQTLGGMDLVSVYLDDDAAQRAQAAFTVLRRQLSPGAAAQLAQALPPEIADWWRGA